MWGLLPMCSTAGGSVDPAKGHIDRQGYVTHEGTATTPSSTREPTRHRTRTTTLAASRHDRSDVGRLVADLTHRRHADGHERSSLTRPMTTGVRAA
jgi:hypothetical protein